MSAVAIARARAYDSNIYATLKSLTDQIGGAESRRQQQDGGVEAQPDGQHHALSRQARLALPDGAFHSPCAVPVDGPAPGAKRIRLNRKLLPGSAGARALGRAMAWMSARSRTAARKSSGRTLKTSAMASSIARMKVPGGGLIFPSYDLNHSFADCDAATSPCSKLKNHWLAGVTMTMKNKLRQHAPVRSTAGDAGPDGNENPHMERVHVGHIGSGKPPQGIPAGTPPGLPARPRLPHSPDCGRSLLRASSVDLSIVDGHRGPFAAVKGEWNQGVERMKPCVLIAGPQPGLRRHRLHRP